MTDTKKETKKECWLFHEWKYSDLQEYTTVNRFGERGPNKTDFCRRECVDCGRKEFKPNSDWVRV